jgi:hypothetical protein
MIYEALGISDGTVAYGISRRLAVLREVLAGDADFAISA